MKELNRMMFLHEQVDLDLALIGSYDPFPVTVSVLIAALASYSAFGISERIRAGKNKAVYAWILVGAFAMGVGVWTMHFIGMLAFSLPVDVDYDPFLTAVSIVPAIIAGGIALITVNIEKPSHRRLLVGAVFMGAGIGVMHYTGMAAMRMDAAMYYDPVLFLVSIIVAVALAFISLEVKTWVKVSVTAMQRPWYTTGGALIMGAAISGMHYTAMAAAYFFPVDESTMVGSLIESNQLALTIGLTSALIIAFVVLAGQIARRLEIIPELEQEIAKRTVIEVQLLKSQNQASNLLNSIRDVFFSVDQDWQLIYVNPRAEKIFQHPVQNVLGQVLWEAVPELASAFYKPLQKALRDQTQTTLEAYYPPLNLWFDARAYPSDGGLSIYLLDITSRKLAEDAAAEREARISAIMDHNPDGIVTIDRHGIMQSVNPMIQTIFGYATEDLIGNNVNMLMPEPYHREHDGYIRAYLTTGQTNLIGGPPRELTGRRKDGSEFPIDLAVADSNHMGEHLFIGIIRDISDRKRAERALKSYAEKLERSNTELQDFAYIASHDLQEPLRKVEAFSERLKDKFGDALDDKGKMYLERMQNATRRMRTLINDLLTYSRVTSKAKPFSTINLYEVLSGVLSDIEVQIEETNAEIDIQSLPIIEADSGQMRQLFQNLIGNAIKYRREGVMPNIRISAESMAIDAAAAAGILTGGEACRMTIADNGIGFEDKYNERIFGIFERLHGRGVYDGTGIGLAACRKIVERHGGLISAQGRQEEGATFTIILPATHPDQEAVQ